MELWKKLSFTSCKHLTKHKVYFLEKKYQKENGLDITSYTYSKVDCRGVTGKRKRHSYCYDLLVPLNYKCEGWKEK